MAEIDTDWITLGDSIAELAAQMDSASHELLTRIRKFDEIGGWDRAQAKSCAHWLAWRIGLGPGSAREHVRVARALGKLPRIDAAMERGQLSFSKVRAMTRVATPENEEQLLLTALQTTGAQLEKICRGVEAVVAVEKPAVGERAVWVQPVGNGLMRVSADLLPDEAALMMKSIGHAQEIFPPVPGAKPGIANRPDALVEMMRVWLEPPAGTTPRPATPIEITIELGPAIVGEAWSAKLADGRGVSAETLRRLACDAGLVLVATDEQGKALDLGRRTRVWSAALRRALWRRDRGCRFPGCTNHRWLDAHHLDPWLHGGETSLARGLLLCKPHHTLVHEGGWTVVTDGDELVFRDPYGYEVRSVPPPPVLDGDAVAALSERADAAGLSITARTNLPGWNGETPDYAACVDAIVRPVSARRGRPN